MQFTVYIYFSILITHFNSGTAICVTYVRHAPKKDTFRPEKKIKILTHLYVQKVNRKKEFAEIHQWVDHEL